MRNKGRDPRPRKAKLSQRQTALPGYWETTKSLGAKVLDIPGPGL